MRQVRLLLYLELLCQLATETIKHGQVEGTKVRIEAERREREKKKRSVKLAIYATGFRLMGGFSRCKRTLKCLNNYI